jgi:CBS domain containing-hemolysin-like protein
MLILEYSPWLAAMAALLVCSAFFSASEAALFYLRRADRRQMAAGSGAPRIAAALLDDPDRLLTAVLFWNLAVNLLYFALASIVGLLLGREGHTVAAGAFAFGALFTVILFGEMLPKSLAVLQPRALATLLAVPLAVMVRLLDPLLPAFRLANLLTQRLLWPRFQSEPYLQIRDLERAVQLSVSDVAQAEQEHRVLESIVRLSEIRADELMRPRTQFTSYRPPIALADLKTRAPVGDYLLVTEPDSDEVAAAIPWDEVWQVPDDHLERLAEPVVYVPWSASGADALELIRRQDRQVAAVVNELGETIGILTSDDILDTIFSGAPSRSERLLRRAPIREAGAGVWHVTGMTGLRRLTRQFRVERPPSKGVTVAGVVQEVLERLPQAGDECDWGPFHFKVLDAPRRGQLLVELTLPGTAEGKR